MTTGILDTWWYQRITGIDEAGCPGGHFPSIQNKRLELISGLRLGMSPGGCSFHPLNGLPVAWFLGHFRHKFVVLVFERPFGHREITSVGSWYRCSSGVGGRGWRCRLCRRIGHPRSRRSGPYVLGYAIGVSRSRERRVSSRLITLRWGVVVDVHLVLSSTFGGALGVEIRVGVPVLSSLVTGPLLTRRWRG